MKDILHKPYELDLKEPMDVCPRGKHSVSFFELVYIVSGKGKQHINESWIDYREGQVFLLAPEDAHQFFFEISTQLFFIRINKSYLKTISSHLLEKIELILSNVNKLPGCLLKKGQNTTIVKTILKNIIQEHLHKTLYSEELIAKYIETLLIIIARNLVSQLPTQIQTKADNKITDILQYIQTNIYDPKKLRVAAISNQFNISDNYLGKFFKKETNQTMQQYIDSYKLKLIENRLQFSDLRINEIADQFNFNDKSHLLHFFRKFHTLSPSKFRDVFKKNN